MAQGGSPVARGEDATACQGAVPSTAEATKHTAKEAAAANVAPPRVKKAKINEGVDFDDTKKKKRPSTQPQVHKDATTVKHVNAVDKQNKVAAVGAKFSGLDGD